MRRVIWLLVALGALTLTFSLPGLTQEGYTQGALQYDPGAGALQYDPGGGVTQYDQGVGGTQYAEQGVAEAGCDWYWGNRWNPAGEWEYWCWDPDMGWWYATSEDGSKQYIRMNKPGVLINARPGF